jgi:hypothetical protein
VPNQKGRSGRKYHQGDDLTKTSQDRKRGGNYESWERKPARK